MLGQKQKGGPAAVIQSAATFNERLGVICHSNVTDIACDRGVTVTETDVPGLCILTESIAGQVVGEFSTPAPIPVRSTAGPLNHDAVTIGEALEATAITASDKPVSSDTST